MWSPVDYAEASVLAREAGEELFSRLDWMTIKPNVIVDMGCGTGEMSVQLQARYKEAKVLALDMSVLMAQQAKQRCPFSVCADASRLPLPDRVVDLIFANFLLPWCPHLTLLLQEWRRVLRPDGLLMFTALGPDTLREGRGVWQSTGLPQFVDMHDMGDLLLQEKFAGPVLDINYYTLTYQNKERLTTELYASRMVVEPLSQLQVDAMVPSEEGTWPITYEVIYAHAFVPADQEEVAASADGTVRIPLSHLRRRRS